MCSPPTRESAWSPHCLQRTPSLASSLPTLVANSNCYTNELPDYSGVPMRIWPRPFSWSASNVLWKSTIILSSCFAKRLEDFFNPILLANLMISSVLICMVGFQIITGRNMFIGDYVKFIIYISSALSQLYVLCENGDALIKQSTLTAQILYECQWEGSDRIESDSPAPTSKRIRNHISFMILCSQQPVRITAFKFSTLSLQSFTAILSTSISYFTLLRSVYFDDGKKQD
ncbi:odorant receptor 13a isoform X3 [Drosophila erecta]|uniref:odorant receptor 13a isoform X3 n=1 Tax=Drosophila erecta TaxID=7220 RepID=UPI000F05D6E1|nr:odorant receptor 13a isoform X3 [Drosophila erecta]